MVRQRHPPPLLERQVRAGVLATLFRGRHRLDSRREAGRARRPSRRGGPLDLRSRLRADPPQPVGGRRHDSRLGQQLLRRGADTGGGRGVLHRPDRRERSRADLLRPELPAGEGGRRHHPRKGVESGRPLLARHREDRLLAPQGRIGGRRAPEVDHRLADQLLRDGRPARVRPLQRHVGEGHPLERRFRERLHRELRRPAGPQGVVGGQRELPRQGGLPPHADHLRERAVVRGQLARRPPLQEEGGEGSIGQSDYRSHAGRRLLPRHPHRHQPAQRRLDPQGVRLEVGNHRQHHLRLRSGGPRQRFPGGVHAPRRGPRPHRAVRQTGRRPAHRHPRVPGPRLGPAGSGREGKRTAQLRLDARGGPRRPFRALLPGRPEARGAGADPLARRGEGPVRRVRHERSDDPAGPHRAGQERRGVAHAQPQADRRVVL